GAADGPFFRGMARDLSGPGPTWWENFRDEGGYSNGTGRLKERASVYHSVIFSRLHGLPPGPVARIRPVALEITAPVGDRGPGICSGQTIAWGIDLIRGVGRCVRSGSPRYEP